MYSGYSLYHSLTRKICLLARIMSGVVCNDGDSDYKFDRTGMSMRQRREKGNIQWVYG
jgi:hypothetical protein